MSLFSSLLIYESSGRYKSVWASLTYMSLTYKSLCRFPQVLQVSECKEHVINSRICGYKVSHVWGNHILVHLFNQTFMFNWIFEQENNVLFILIPLLLFCLGSSTYFLKHSYVVGAIILVMAISLLTLAIHVSSSLLLVTSMTHFSCLFFLFHISPIRWQDLWVWLKDRTLNTKGRFFWMTSDSFLSSSLLSSIFHISLLWSTTYSPLPNLKLNQIWNLWDIIF